MAQTATATPSEAYLVRAATESLGVEIQARLFPDAGLDDESLSDPGRPAFEWVWNSPEGDALSTGEKAVLQFAYDLYHNGGVFTLLSRMDQANGAACLRALKRWAGER